MKMTSNEIRASFLKYFAQRGHRVVPSSPLVPADDPTLLFTNAGMNQFKDVLLGREKREYTRAVTAQKCMRVSGKHNDLDNVGPSLRHHTFFEMLGNFSFGDYFKRDAIRFAWELLTEVWKIPPDRLVPSIFKGDRGIPRDDDAYELWKQFVPADRILELGLDDNFWQMGDTGPCGRSSEIYYRRGAGSDPEIEIWNNVFMEFERSADGTLTPLPAPSIDTGMGLERLTAVLQRKDSNYDTDLFTPLLDRIGELSHERYGGTNRASDISMRVVADHIRAMTFLIADGVIPSNEWRGYVLRKIMRRAMRHGRHLGMTEPFLHRLVAVLDREMGGAYPELRANRETIEKTILAEEKRFGAVLAEGLPKLEAEIAKALASPERTLSGEAAFRLYDTFGLPYEFIEDTAATQDIGVARDGFERAMEGQRDQARAKGGFKPSDSGQQFGLPRGRFEYDEQAMSQAASDEAAKKHFVGYDTTAAESPVLMLWNAAGDPTERLDEGQVGFVALAETPFYIEAGGQVDDRGEIRSGSALALVEKLIRPPSSAYPRLHRIRVSKGSFHLRDIVTAEVHAETRNATRRNHTATHLLHAALRQVLGAHVKQSGSLVAPDRLRFDFAHFQPVTREEQERIEDIVNERIRRNSPVLTDERPTEEAIAAGAMALFGEKYGDRVRVVSVPGFSQELCGGTHVSATGDIGFFAIFGESGVAAGVRRIEAVTGAGAVQWAQRQRAELAQLLGALHVNEDQAVEAVEKLQRETKRLSREITQLKTKLAMGGASRDETDDTIEVAGVRVARRKVADLDKDALRQLADSLKAKIKTGVVVLASANDGKVQIVVAVTPDLTSRVKAGQIVKEIAPIVGGGGGGRPDFAEAGGKQPERIDELLQASEAVIARLLRQ
jgi:alanyl-tRNA synthetase